MTTVGKPIAVHSACSESVGGPSCAARGRQPQFRRRSDRWTTSPRPQNVGQRHVSPSAAHRSAFRAVSRILVTTSGELILLPVGSRHPNLNLGRRPVTRYSDSDIPRSSSRTFPAFRTSESKMAAKTTSGSGFDLKFRLFALGFLLES